MTADLLPVRLLLVTLAGWVNRHQQHVIEYLVEENRALREQRPAPPPRVERPATRSPGFETGGDDRDARHDPALVPAADCPEVDV